MCEEVAMEIRAGHLIVLLEERRDLLVFDWKTGQNVAVSIICIVNNMIF